MTQTTETSIDTIAARWVARIDSENWTDADERALDEWLEHDPRHQGAFVHAQAIWTMLSEDKAQYHTDGGQETPAVSRRKIIAGAGGLLAASFIGGLFLFGPNNRYTTEIGELRRVALQDGSTAAINTDSRMDIAFAKDQRRVRLDRGEVWFQVTKDSRRPFIVEAGNIRVRAVGTAFSVRRRPDGADIIVSEGVVEAWAAGAEGPRLRLPSGSRAHISENASISRQSAEPDGVERSLAWRSGKIDLVGTRVDDAIAEINRYNQRKILLLDSSLSAERFDGIFQTNDPEGFARVIAGSFDRSLDLTNANEIRIQAR